MIVSQENVIENAQNSFQINQINLYVNTHTLKSVCGRPAKLLDSFVAKTTSIILYVYFGIRLQIYLKDYSLFVSHFKEQYIT